MENTKNSEDLTDQDIIVAIEWAESDDPSLKNLEKKLGVRVSASQYIHLARLLREGFRRNMIQRTKWIRGFTSSIK